ncbi:tetratricopeptide repeat protein [Dongia soli]|uniref:Tetratricopeptide repeat protein n=1 Tax=Dongia soli TaxID=600628 RepID=A0ABU5E5B5_9PROT|nr:tetratricopeptide repeat protein [Dongia soli]MDY0881393.1 tetratricopeptide repeat protein [Dongia soli]
MTTEPQSALLEQAMRAIARIDLAGARRYCEEALHQQPGDAAAMHLMGIMIHHEGGKAHEALGWLERAAAHDATNSKYQNSCGVLLFEMGRFQEAAQAFYRSTNLDGGDGLIWNNLGNALLRLGQAEDAERCFRQSLAVMPGLISAINNLGLALKFQGQLEKAAICFQEAALHQPGFVDAHFNLGELAYYTDDMEAATRYFRRAIEIDPNCRPAYASLAQVLHDQEKPAEALALLQDAVRRFPDDADLEFALRLQLSSMVPAWHIPMINDTERNRAYDAALRAAVSPGDLVLEIGTGSGLVSMMAARAGAGQVVTCEVLPALAEAAVETVARNGFSDRIKVIPKKSTQLEVGTDLPEKADVFVSELVNIGMLAPNMLQVLSHARQKLVKPEAKIIPAAARVYGALLECPHLARINPVHEIEGFDLSYFDRFRSPAYAQIDLAADPHRFLSAPFTALDFDFCTEMPMRDQRRLLISVRETGVVHGIAFWFDLFMDNTTTYHSSSVSRTNHWKQAAEFFLAPIAVAPGDELAVEVGYDNTRIWFKPIR